jgi:Dna[CI] antecedent, DciA
MSDDRKGMGNSISRGSGDWGGAGKDFERVGDLIGEVGALRPGGAGSDPEDGLRRRLAAIWPKVVGPEISANARPLRLSRGNVVVATSSSAWAQTLGFMSEEIRTGLNAALEGGPVQSLSFHHAGWEDRGGVLQPTDGPRGLEDPAFGPGLTEEQQAALGEIEELDLEPGLKDKITQAMRASFVRGGQDKVR